ncbi:hypothetical protein HRbin17_00875 [bacterium HR17]|uniref:Uncharacterized protein n=1 Tax=Candidatus Fervidibacter japonicus TaxID=2035412 RepID=A0A2H5XAZ8_9BACT|nr:hypothetical protein HRbin17_00875 [bacterium HR17]
MVLRIRIRGNATLIAAPAAISKQVGLTFRDKTTPTSIGSKTVARSGTLRGGRCGETVCNANGSHECQSASPQRHLKVHPLIGKKRRRFVINSPMPRRAHLLMRRFPLRRLTEPPSERTFSISEGASPDAPLSPAAAHRAALRMNSIIHCFPRPR